MLKIEHLSKLYNKKTVLNDISLSVNHGEIAVLLGSSGVGKSTILRILNNLETVDKGTISLDGKPLDLATVNKTHTVGFLFQHFNLFEHLTVRENITLALEKVANKTKEQAQKIAQELLKQYGIAQKANAYISDLSGGQKQRLAIVRTLALKPQILCLDEPSSALDPLLTAYVASTINDLAKQGYIVLVATHDTTLLQQLNCTIYLMKEGKIIETAKSEELKKFPEKYPHIIAFVKGHAS